MVRHFTKLSSQNSYYETFLQNLSHETFSTKLLCTELFCAEPFRTKPSLELLDTGVMQNFYYETIVTELLL